MESKAKKISCAIILAASLFFGTYIELFIEKAGYHNSGTLTGFIGGNPQLLDFIRPLLICAVVFALCLAVLKLKKPVLRFIYQYRYAVGLAMLIVCVAFEISGSSIAVLGKMLGSEQTGTIFGIPRPIRSDEFAVLTPFSFSQYYNPSGQYPYFSETIRGTMTDTFIVYGLPSWDIASIFRPFLWGYLLFGPAKGLAFFWGARLLALFFVSFEFAMIYTKKEKWLSLGAAFLISLAPVVQWWFAVNGLAEMLVFGQLALLCVYHYMQAEKLWRKIAAALLFFWSGGVYILTFYPAWQIPLLYVFAALLVYIVLENRKAFAFRWKTDLPIILGGLIALAAGLLYIWSKSGDTIKTVMNTVYPGQRSNAGGNGFLSLFRYGAGIFFPLTASGLDINQCESAAFFDLFPMGILMSLFVIIAEKKKDKMLIALLTAQCILLTYCVFGLPDIIAKITLLSHSTTNRAVLAVGLINVLLLIRSMGVMERKINLGLAIAASAVLSVSATLLSRSATGAYVNKYFFILIAGILFVGFLIALLAHRFNWKRLFAILCVFITVISGGLVNPIQRGVDTIYKNDLMTAIQEVVQKGSGRWIVEAAYPINEAPIMAGGPTVNSTNVYPDLERWRQLDPEGQYEDIYNRYAHIDVDLTDEDTRFELLSTDYFKVILNYDDLEKLDVQYILTVEDYTGFSNPHVQFSLIKQIDGFRIYEVSYIK